MPSSALLSLFLTALPLAQGFNWQGETWGIKHAKADSCDQIGMAAITGRYEKNCTRANWDDELVIFESDVFKMIPYGTWKKLENGQVVCEDPQDIDTKKCMHSDQLHKIAGFEVKAI